MSIKVEQISDTQKSTVSSDYHYIQNKYDIPRVYLNFHFHHRSNTHILIPLLPFLLTNIKVPVNTPFNMEFQSESHHIRSETGIRL